MPYSRGPDYESKLLGGVTCSLPCSRPRLCDGAPSLLFAGSAFRKALLPSAISSAWYGGLYGFSPDTGPTGSLPVSTLTYGSE